MKIGELAAATDTPVETIRYYEKQGLLAEPARSEGNYRVYGSAQVERLRFIRHCRSLDMSLDEVRLLLRYKDSPGRDCGDVNALLDEHIGHVSQRIRELKRLEKQLRELRAQCASRSDTAHCGILGEITQASRARRKAAPAQPARHLGPVHGPR
ncbi:Cd(II)/Pb(II)-responsive transcriptional regulator [Piscinibacter sp.]|uniref:Cd(II)/Pb(II)-responsive transcriptional regulator n=1 Tax=Piscinibacter sp. TaxID=1903157 RepID=UPI0039E4D1A5